MGSQGKTCHPLEAPQWGHKGPPPHVLRKPQDDGGSPAGALARFLPPPTHEDGLPLLRGCRLQEGAGEGLLPWLLEDWGPDYTGVTLGHPGWVLLPGGEPPSLAPLTPIHTPGIRAGAGEGGGSSLGELEEGALGGVGELRA